VDNQQQNKMVAAASSGYFVMAGIVQLNQTHPVIRVNVNDIQAGCVLADQLPVLPQR
jgi:hypothetical protein